MKNVKTYESWNQNEKVVYWLVPTDKRLADSIVKIMAQYGDKEDRIEVIDDALELTNEINDKKIKDRFVYISMTFYTNEYNEVSGSPRFGWFEISFRNIMDKKEKHYYVGTVNIEDYELDADKYNL